MIWLFIHKKGKLAKFWVVFPITVHIFDPEYHCQASLRFAFVMLCLVFMKFRKLKSLHQENRKLNPLKSFTLQVIKYSTWQKLSSKCYSEFFIDVIRKELRKSLLLSKRFSISEISKKKCCENHQNIVMLTKQFPFCLTCKEIKEILKQPAVAS